MIAYVVEAFGVLFANRVRTLLTALGLVIGVTAVIAIQTLGAGLAGAIDGALGAFNDRSFTLIVQVRQPDFVGALLDFDDIARVLTTVPGVSEAIPGGGTVRAGNVAHARAKLLVGAESDDPFNTSAIAAGRGIARDDMDRAASVAVLTDGGRTKLFGDVPTDVVGTTLRLGERRYAIVGVLAPAKSGVLGSFGSSSDVLIPATTYRANYVQRQKLSVVRFMCKPGVDLQQTEDAAIAAIKASPKKKTAQYITFDKRQFSRLIDGFFSGITLVVSLIGAVSLVVAGIGILNIMLVSVAERTREIGLRKAIGATRLQILAQFFIEALLLSAIGCAIGLVLGLAIGFSVNALVLVKLSGVVAPIPWLQATLIATGFATLVTLVFGTYPAWRAAQLDPIEALRYE